MVSPSWQNVHHFAAIKIFDQHDTQKNSLSEKCSGSKVVQKPTGQNHSVSLPLTPNPDKKV